MKSEHHDLSFETYCLTLPKNRRIIVLFFRNIQASKILIIRVMAIMVLSEIFCPAGPKNFKGVISVFHKISSMEQKLWIKNGGLTFLRRRFRTVSEFQNISGRTVHCFIRLRVSETSMHKKEISLFSVGISLPHSAEIICRVPFCISDDFSIEDLHALEKGGGHHGIVKKKLCLTGPKRKTFYGNCLVVKKNYWHRLNFNG